MMADMMLYKLRSELASRPGILLESNSLKPAAVLLLVYPRDGQLHVLFSKRTDEVEYHKGEISFPGGAQDPQDADLVATGVRETYEEMGVRPEDLSILGHLDDVTTNSSRFLIRTYVGTIPYPYDFKINHREVAEVLEVPLGALLDPLNRRDDVLLERDGGLVKSYAYVYDHNVIWGATARILTQFLSVVSGLRP